MQDFQYLKDQISGKWVVSAPRRAKRPIAGQGAEPTCPFCAINEPIIYESGSVTVVYNKFPFAPIHEIIIHSPDHHKNFGELPESQVELILKVYKQRYNALKDKGQVYIFHNRGVVGGESLPHPHTQLAVVDNKVHLDIPPLCPDAEDVANSEETQIEEGFGAIESKEFLISCPKTSQWPDEVWVFPKRGLVPFGDINDEEITDLAKTLTTLVKIFDVRHGNEFPYNFYIYPGADWYLRLIPRGKTLGGFEIGTGIFINTQDPKETLEFIKEHFENPNEERIKEQTADYFKAV